MKHGTIVRNMYQPSYESLLVYCGIYGRYAKCLWLINGEVNGVHNYYKTDILNDREHFPIVGFVDCKKALVDAIRKVDKLEALRGKNARIFVRDYMTGAVYERGEGS